MKSTPLLSYLTKEAFLLLLLSYFTLVAGKPEAWADFRIRFAADLILLVILAVWLYTRVRQRASLPRTPLDAPIVGFLGVNAVATALSVGPRLSLEGLLQTCTYVLVFYLLVDLIRHGWPVSLFVKSLLAVGGIACILGIIETLTWYLDWLSIGGLPDVSPPISFRLSGGNSMAAYLNLLIPLGITEAIRVRRLPNRLIIAAWLVLALVIEFLTFSRGGWLGLAVALVCLCALLTLGFGRSRILGTVSGRFGKWQRTLAIGGTLVIAVPLLLAAGAMGYRQISTHPSHAYSAESRLLFWRSAIDTLTEHPLTGAGPSNYGTQLFKHNHPPPRWMVEKAHNVFLTIGAETGILGLAAVAWLSFALARGLQRTWIRASRRQRFLVAACAANLAASFIHNQVEDFLGSPGFIITTIFLIALSLETGVVVSQDVARRASRRRLKMSWFAILALGVALLRLWIDVPVYHYDMGANRASVGDFVEAIPYLEHAAELDPGFAFYHLQLGKVHGLVAAADVNNNRNLEEAISAYERGIALEPYFAYNSANLASLYWQAGLREQAIASMEKAISALADEPLFHLNLGYYAEVSGDTDQATQEYTRFLSSNANLARASFWRQTPLRRSLVEDEENVHPTTTVPSSPQSYWDLMTVAWSEYQAGDLEQAEVYFELALASNPALPHAYRGLAELNLRLGHLDEAESLARQALFTGDSSNPHFILGRSAYLRGNLARAIDEYILGFTEYFHADKYALLIFRREFIDVPELLPQVIQLNFTDYHASRAMELAQLYEEAHELEKARQVYQTVLDYDPTSQPALEGVERLGQRD